MEWRLFPLDLLLFRGTEPMNAGEAAVVRSRFPPSPETLQGFVRAALLEALGVTFADYTKGLTQAHPSASVQKAMTLLGRPEGDLGQLQVRGPYLVTERGTIVERWCPAPLDLVREDQHWRTASHGDAVPSDLGPVPFILAGGGAAGMWVNERGLIAYLRGEPVLDVDVRRGKAEIVAGASSDKALYSFERRVGIARDRATHATREGMLYAPEFVRLHADRSTRVGIGLTVDGIPDDVQRQCAGIRRLGGQGRMAEVNVHPVHSLPAAPPSGTRFRLLLLTPARWGGSWLPPSAQQTARGWTVTLAGITFHIVTAAVGKYERIGGWNIVNQRPKPAEACVPAGSVYLVELDVRTDLSPLHDHQLGDGARAGFGHVAVGHW